MLSCLLLVIRDSKKKTLKFAKLFNFSALQNATLESNCSVNTMEFVEIEKKKEKRFAVFRGKQTIFG